MNLIWIVMGCFEISLAAKYANEGNISMTIVFCFAAYICYDHIRRNRGDSNG